MTIPVIKRTSRHFRCWLPCGPSDGFDLHFHSLGGKNKADGDVVDFPVNRSAIHLIMKRLFHELSSMSKKSAEAALPRAFVMLLVDLALGDLLHVVCKLSHDS